MTTARTASMRTLWTALQGSAPIHDVSLRSVDSAEAVRRRLTKRLHLRSAMPGWRIEDRSRGAILRFRALERAPWRWLGGTIELRGEITPSGAGCALEAACFTPGEARWHRVGFGDLLSVAALAAFFGVMLGAELASAQPDLHELSAITVALATLPVALVRRLRAERSARAIGDWVAQTLAPVAGENEPG